MNAVSMSNDGNRMVVGAKLDDTPGTSAGSVEVYEYSSGSWTKMGSTIRRPFMIILVSSIHKWCWN